MEAHKTIKRGLKRKLIDLSKKNSLARSSFRKLRLIKNRSRYAMFQFSEIDEKAIVFESFMGRKYSDNPRAVYEYMLKSDEYREYRFIWAFKDIERYSGYTALKNDRTSLVKYGSREYYRAYGTSKYWISNSRIPEAIYRKKGQIYVQCWHGTPLKRLGYDIKVEGKNALNSNKDIREKYRSDAKRYSYMLSSSGFCTEKFVSAFNLKAFGKENVIIEEGFPRNDILSNYKEDDVRRVRESIGLKDNRKTILYAPTWRDNQHDSGRGYVYENEMDFDMLMDAISDSYAVLFRAHYFVANKFDFERYKGFVYDVSDYEDIGELYIASDMLITDYSSVFFDYAILRRPIIFYMYDLQEYENELRGFYLSLDELPGSICTKEAEVIGEIFKCGGGELHPCYDEFNRKYNYLDDGNSTGRIVNIVFPHAN